MNTEPGTLLTVIALVLGAALLCGYVAVAILVTRKLWGFTIGYREWARVLLCTLVLAVFVAPGFMAAGHGAGVAPAWVALVDPSSNRFAVKSAVISLAITWGLLFVIGVIVRRIRKHQ